MSGTGFDPLREALIQADLPTMSIVLAQRIHQARVKKGACNIKANATDSDVAPLIRAGFVRICDNKALDFTRKAVAFLNGSKVVPKRDRPLVKTNGNTGKSPEKHGRMVSRKGNRVFPDGHR